MVDFKSVVSSWDEFTDLFRIRFDAEFTTMDKLLDIFESRNEKINWTDLCNWEEMEDVEIFSSLTQSRKITDEVYVLSEVSYKKEYGPFRVGQQDIGAFVAGHLEAYGECLFNGDVYFIDLNARTLWVFHHEGLCSVIQSKLLG